MRIHLREQQRRWAESEGLAVDVAWYVHLPEANLPWLTARTRADFAAGDGGEFGQPGKRPKIAALHSSSALAVNVFDYWTSCDPTPLAAALSLQGGISEIRFERKFPTGVGPRAPNLDIVIRGPSELLAIESKFCESFDSKSSALQPKYFPKGKALWSEAGLPGAQEAALKLRTEDPFDCVDAVQLLKHMLGLARAGFDWRLLLLWFVPSRSVGLLMDAEALKFKQFLGPDGARFGWLSYQKLWGRLRPMLAPGDREYQRYLTRRYFPDVV